ncbi:MAG: TolC family protein [Desulfococcaceae bacterium]
MKIIKTAAMLLSLLITGTCAAFADADANSNPALTLEQCIETALKNNPEAAAVQWDAEAADFRYNQAEAALLPSVSIEGGYNHFLDPQRLIAARYNGEPGDFDRDMFRTDIVVRMPVYTGGRITNEIAAADLLRKAEEHKLARTREEIVLNVSSVFYSILGYGRVIESLEFSIQVLEEHLKRVSQLLAAQKASRLDYLKTEVRLADLRQSLVNQKNTLAVQKRVLANLMGTEQNSQTFSVSGKLEFEPSALQTESLIGQALGARSDYLSAKAKFEAQTRKISIAKSAYLPQVSLQGGYGFRTDINGENEDAGTLGITAVMPIFDRKTAPKVSEEEANLSAARERLRKLELQIRQDVETEVLDIQSAAERIMSIEKAIEQAKESLRIERQKYELGAGSMTDVLDAQSALLQTETAYYKAMADVNIAKARLNWAAGGMEN